MKIKHFKSIVFASCMMLIFLLNTSAMNIYAEAVVKPSLGISKSNSMPQPTEEQLAKAREKLEKCNQYVKLKNEGKYEQALMQLKRIWPNSKTTVADIIDAAASGEKTMPEESLEPMETQPDILLKSRFQQKHVNVTHCMQENCSYCGPASLRIVLTNQMSNPPSQAILANGDHLNTAALGQTSFDYLLPQTLNRYMNTSGAYELAWGGIFTAETLKNAMMSSLDAGYPILANGISGGQDSYVTLSWYPAGTQHFVCVYGYSNYGNTTWVCDPVAGTSCQGFGAVIEKYGYSESTFYLFISPRGIVY